MIPKTCNLHPTCTTVVSETNCCCHLLPTSIELFPCGSQSSRSYLCQGTPLLPSTPTQCGPVRNRLSSVGFDPIFTDAQHGCTSEWTADSINVVPQHETCHGMGWDEDANLVSWQSNSFETCCHSSSFCYHVESTDCVLLFIFWVRVCLLNEVAFSRNLENWYLPICNFRSP